MLVMIILDVCHCYHFRVRMTKNMFVTEFGVDILVISARKYL